MKDEKLTLSPPDQALSALSPSADALCHGHEINARVGSGSASCYLLCVKTKNPVVIQAVPAHFPPFVLIIQASCGTPPGTPSAFALCRTVCKHHSLAICQARVRPPVFIPPCTSHGRPSVLVTCACGRRLSSRQVQM